MRRMEVPEQLADPSRWPGVDPSALDADARDLFLRREQAIRQYVAGGSPAHIERQFGIHPSSVRRLLARCLAPHPDGRIQGLRGLLPNARVTRYRRTAPARTLKARAGMSGAIGQLFERLPQLPRILERELASGSLGISANNRLYGLTAAHSRVLAACREAGLGADDYPFNQESAGYRSLAAWIRLRLQSRMPLSIRRGVEDAWQASARPYGAVELDGHRLDVRVRVRFSDSSGIPIDLETERLFVITVIDVCTRVVLGWQLVAAPQYDHTDVLATLQDALRPRRNRPVSPILSSVG